MLDYYTLKAIHVGCVVASIAGFAGRYLLMLADSPLRNARALRVAPHLIDTVLLASAVAMAWQLSLNPLHHPWLAAKIVALLVYIVLGTIALRRGRTRGARALTGLAAMLVYAYMVMVAVTKSPLGPLAG